MFLLKGLLVAVGYSIEHHAGCGGQFCLLVNSVGYMARSGLKLSTHSAHFRSVVIVSWKVFLNNTIFNQSFNFRKNLCFVQRGF